MSLSVSLLCCANQLFVAVAVFVFALFSIFACGDSRHSDEPDKTSTHLQ
jgi:hypothetical protein